MKSHPRLLVFAGSLRRESLNKRLARLAAERLRLLGAEAAFLDLADLPMPLFNQDDEAAHGLPPNAQAFKKQLIGHDGFLIASPEYNGSIPPALKNALDWASRADKAEGPLSAPEPPLVAFRGKVAALVSASPGALGGLRGLTPLRAMLANVGVWVAPEQLAVRANALLPDPEAPGDPAKTVLAEPQNTLFNHLLKAFVEAAQKWA